MSTYYSKLKDLGDEYDAMTPTLSCPCLESKVFLEHIQQQRLVRFLSSLNESFARAKRQIMLMIPTPNINEAYAMVVHDKKKRAKATGISYGANIVAYNTGQAYTGGYKQKNQLYCDYCKLKGHTRNVCYKLVGYPTDFKPMKAAFGRNVTAAHDV
ncbi:hypothetical protein A4A49_53063 [Nicotiana attenuata]|uniref:Uncharacterized protein n=1 Tax=Nicotiana attenuata TaxID=49451 RepID=A0A314KI95_NICAT|nr:hypothetical protein A4A49_53063 [Nicotiana attenuata]